MRVALYARVSTTDQTVAPQLDSLRAYASARRLEVAGEYVDEGISGARDRRPALDALVAQARRRAFDAVAVVKLDRLARSTRHLTQLGGELEALGVDLIVTDQGIDTSTPAGRLLFNVLGAIGEFELDLIRERTRAGLRAARKRGARLGRPRARLDLSHALERLERGETVAAVAKRFGIARSTLRKRVAEWRKTLRPLAPESAVSPLAQ
jgi:DNA invertase Pin-like site-specific DNA recombinase